jgi:hypothetical protein
MPFGSRSRASRPQQLQPYLQGNRCASARSSDVRGHAFKAATLDRSVTPPDAWLSHIQLFPPLGGSEPDDTDVISCCRNGLRSAGARRRRHSRSGSPADAANRHRINCKPVSKRRCTSLEPARRPGGHRPVAPARDAVPIRGPPAASAATARRPARQGAAEAVARPGRRAGPVARRASPCPAGTNARRPSRRPCG